MPRRRILTGSIVQESHSFVGRVTTRSDFLVETGDTAIASSRKTNSQLGGILDAAAELDIDVSVPIAASANPGGPVAEAFYAEASDLLIGAARSGGFDAVVVALHGAMLTPAHEDPEGVLLAALRDAVGPEVPVTAAFDLHGHVTPQALSSCDLIAGFLTNPHSDMAQTGKRALRAAVDILDRCLLPICANVHIPMLTLGNDRTDTAPLKQIHAGARREVDSGHAYDISIFNVQQFLDVADLGQSVLVYTNGDPESAETLALRLATDLWEQRDNLVARYPALEDVLTAREASPLITVIGDQGDRVAAGSVGDSTYIIERVRAMGYGGKVLIPICDPAAVEHCRNAGEGAELSLTFGGRHCRVSPPQILSGRVVSAGANVSRPVRGPVSAGLPARVGEFAVFEANRTVVVLTSEPCSFLDPAYYETVGVPVDSFDLIVTRSGYHFTLNFAGVGECVVVDTPGPTSFDPTQFNWKRARPFYPLDPDLAATNPVRLRTFRGSARS